MSPWNSRRRAITLIELLIAIAVVAVLLSLLAVGIGKVRKAAALAHCSNQLRQLGLACHNVNDTHKRMPPAFGFFPKSDIFNGSNGLGTLFFHLLPYLEQQNLYQKARFQAPYKRRKFDYFLYTANEVHRTSIPLFNCPADPTWKPYQAGAKAATDYAPSSYAANYLVFGVVLPEEFYSLSGHGRPSLATSFRDGTSNTVLFAEKYASASITAVDNGAKGYEGGCHWAYFQGSCYNPLFGYIAPGYPTNDHAIMGPENARFQIGTKPANTNPCLPATGHTVMPVGMADATVRHLASGMERATWWALMTPAGGEPAGE